MTERTATVQTAVSRDGTTIAYDESGSGPPLILVNGALSTRTSGSQAELTGLLSPHFRVVGYDRRGRGDSGDTLPYAVDREIEDVEALIDHAGGSAFLFGHSSGGCLVLETALRLPGKAAKIAIYEAPYDDGPVAGQAWPQYIAALTEALAAGHNRDAVALFMRYVGTPAERVEQVRQLPFWPGLEALAPTLAYDHTGLIGISQAVPVERLAAVSVPTLVLSGGASYPFMAETARTISRAIPGAQLRILDGQDHNVQPAALAPALIEFLSGLAQGHS